MTSAVPTTPELAAAPRPLASPTNTLEQDPLISRVRQCVPTMHPAFGKLLQLLSIELTEQVPTAAVTVGSLSRLRINPRFVAEWCRTDEHLTMLVMHELYHLLLGHTRLHQRCDLASNWAFDCIINAQLCRMYRGLEYTSFFAVLAAAEGPWSLLGPPPGWPSRPSYAAGRLGDLHRRLYEDEGVTIDELFAMLEKQELPPDENGKERLLGNHTDEAERDPLEADPELTREVRRIVAQWPMAERRISCGNGNRADWERCDLRHHVAARRAVQRLVCSSACSSERIHQSSSLAQTPASLPLPQPRDRRGHLQRLLGLQPLWWQGQVQPPSFQSAQKVTVYLDVSDSMANWLPVLLAALTDCAAWVRWPLLGFSTEVWPLSRADLAQGRYRSNHGTDMACVARHLLDARVRRALVITDGDVQQVPDRLAGRLRRAKPTVYVGLLDGCSASFCDGLGWHVHQIPPLDADTIADSLDHPRPWT